MQQQVGAGDQPNHPQALLLQRGVLWCCWLLCPDETRHHEYRKSQPSEGQ